MSLDRSTSIFRRLPADAASGLRTTARHELARVYRSNDLIVLGLGAMIGAGIFSIAGRQAATTAGPGVILSFLIAGITMLLSALCYGELSSTLPVSGSAYSYTYVIFGEVWAWIIGWALILEMQVAIAVVSRVWSIYFAQTLTDLGVSFPDSVAWMIGKPEGFDLPTLVIIGLLTLIVAGGARVGMRALYILVGAKLLAIGAVIVVGALNFDQANIDGKIPAPLGPAPEQVDLLHSTVIGAFFGEAQTFGWFGIFAAAPAIAFAYIGWDIVATAAEETSDAPRTIPTGVIRSLVLATVLYIGVAVVMVGMVPYDQIDPGSPLGAAFRHVGADIMPHIINIGAFLGLTSVILVLIVGLTRVVFSVARDGLLPRGLASINRRYRSPSRLTMIIGGTAIVLAETVPVLTLEQLTVMGTVFAFTFVAAGVIVMRRTMPDLPRGFRVPLSPAVPTLAVLASVWLMMNLQVVTWLYFAAWMAFGLIIYLVYGRPHSMLDPRARAYAQGRHRR
ncbi:amino acid permease [Spongiactinospora sp. TRM90649]|uniref:APC family permease n=1 Tax=Spongiactinospora sp. TRM90649 TaxID=3031114 RepID=UPI0023F979EB|nr:amino acid permease [Spongiactinospora sp. TRM90649]MDF5756108.1 amino acid permease [Spongiactinospora sp. TRM90649]